jgi:TPR repeat protein
MVSPEAERLRQSLIRRIGEQRDILINAPDRLDGYLQDDCPGTEHRGLRRLLLDVLEDRIPQSLQDKTPGLPMQMRIRNKTEEFQREHGLSAENALWAVESWALALDLELPAKNGQGRRRSIFSGRLPWLAGAVVLLIVLLAVPAALLGVPPLGPLDDQTLQSLRDSASSSKIAFYRLEGAAEIGNPMAAFYLGTLYDPDLASELSYPLPSNEQTSFNWYRKSALEGDGTAAINTAIDYDLATDYPNALQFFQLAIAAGTTLTDGQKNDMGDAALQSAIADYKAKDYQDALTDYLIAEKMATLKPADLTNIGEIYASGWAGALQWDKAASYYQRAAATDGLADCQLAAITLIGGHGITGSFDTAQTDYAAAAKLGDFCKINITITPPAPTDDDTLYGYENAASSDSVSFWRLETAAASGNVYAEGAMASLYDPNLDPPLAHPLAANAPISLDWWEAAGAVGDGNAACNVSRNLLWGGSGITPDIDQATSWYEKSAADEMLCSLPVPNSLASSDTSDATLSDDANQAAIDNHRFWALEGLAANGNALAELRMGTLYDPDLTKPLQHPMPHNDFIAFSWYQKSAQDGNAQGACNLSSYYRDGGTNVSKDPGQAAKWYAIALKGDPGCTAN